MNEGKGKIWFLRGGLFAKYVFALVGLVVFVLAINGAMETWISYRATRTSLTDGMSEKAEATAKRIEQSMAEMERQINWVTRASATKLDSAGRLDSTATIENHRADYAQLLNTAPSVSQLSFISAQGREQLRLSRLAVSYGSNVDFSRDVKFTETLNRGTSLAPAYFRDQSPFISIAFSHSGYGVTVAEIDLALPLRLSQRRPGRPIGALPMSSTRAARCWRVRRGGPRSAARSRTCRRWRPCWRRAAACRHRARTSRAMRC